MSSWSSEERYAYKLGIEKGLALAANRKPLRFFRWSDEAKKALDHIEPGEYVMKVRTSGGKSKKGILDFQLERVLPYDEEIPF